jgi:hypothetical protein
MAVTKQVYTLSPTWTASGLASLFRSAFIDAGLMTEWYDDFLSGSVENRILEVVNDGTKTYGTVYYWFMFTTTEVRVHTALGWNTTTNVPTGTQYQDYFSTTTNSISDHSPLYSTTTGGTGSTLVTTTSLTLTRYTSAINTSCTWFILSQSAFLTFLVPFGAYTATSFVDQNVTAFNGLLNVNVWVQSTATSLRFNHKGAHTRRTYLGATATNGATIGQYYYTQVQLLQYGAIGSSSQATDANLSSLYSIMLPTARTNTHTGLANDYTPVFTSIQCSPYLPVLPADFALCSYYASTAVVTQDTFIVSAGVEEYEVLMRAAGSSGVILFLARTV